MAELLFGNCVCTGCTFYTNDTKNEEKVVTEKMKFAFSSGKHIDKSDITLDLTRKSKELTGKKEIKSNFELKITTNGIEDTLKGDITQSLDVNMKEAYSNSEIFAKMDMNFKGSRGQFEFNLDTNTKLQDKLDIPNIDEGSFHNIVEMTEAETVKLLEEVSMNIYGFSLKYGLISEDDYYYE